MFSMPGAGSCSSPHVSDERRLLLLLLLVPMPVCWRGSNPPGWAGTRQAAFQDSREPFGIFCTGASFLRIAPVKVARQAKLLNFPPRFALGQAGTLLGIWVAHTLQLRPLKGHTNTPAEGGGDYNRFSWPAAFPAAGRLSSLFPPPQIALGVGQSPPRPPLRLPA